MKWIMAPSPQSLSDRDEDYKASRANKTENGAGAGGEQWLRGFFSRRVR